nr:alpha/beta hydrolase [Neobacillus sp. Marseille-Q6967]
MEYKIRVEPNVKIFVNDMNPTGRNPILFIHGWPANHKMFEYQYNYLLQRGHRCIGLDMRGFGQSDKPLHGYDYDRLADDVRGVVDALGLRDFTLAGHSTGGAVAIRYMARHNGYGVSKLALFAAAAPSLIQRPHFPYGLKKEDVDQIIQATWTDRPNMLRDFGKKFFHQPVSQPFSDWFFQLGLQAASWSTISIALSWLAEQLFYDLAKIHVPTLILHGIHDQIVPYPLALAQKKGIKSSILVSFENSGHGVFNDERDKFNRELSRFIS